MDSLRNKQLIGNRYQIINRLGEGGMGIVYRVKDRLTGETVALKRVMAHGDQLDFAAMEPNTDVRLALAQEFRTLASLRHPHIISVLDYGFDEHRQPYYTMNLLEHSQEILTVAYQQDDEGKLDLIIQMLQALAYLHHRGIAHRDLKPGNVLVVGGENVKLLDFGLAVKTSEGRGPGGTLTYMAPEVFRGEPAGIAADVYAAGLIAYECFAGRHPFDTSSIATLIAATLNEIPDVFGLPIQSGLQGLIGRLLMKDPRDRYQDANDVIRHLCLAAGRPIPDESVAIREGYLQAARFVGRDEELAQLQAALSQAYGGKGSSWLIGGESGVGKSRLMDELRTHALVEGAMVLFGQAVEGGGAPYQLWREPIRRLVLSAELSELEIGILEEVVPDIGNLLGCDVVDPPELDRLAGQQRLLRTIADIFKQQQQPMLLLLEDLQWTISSLEPLKVLNRFVSKLPLLIVANYRDDERPGLSADLPDMNHLKLGRLKEPAIAELSQSMLGESGRHPKIIDYLRKETEGNVFFIVEVVRALAEEAGRLHDISMATLPERIFARGMQEIVRRRLAKLPEQQLPLLKLAAVAGREIDPKILSSSIESSAFEDWLLACETAIILEIHDNHWRFSHDKLREAVLADLNDDERPILHRQVASAIEDAYPDDKGLAAVLAQHWSVAGDVEKERHYARMAGELAQGISNFLKAHRLLERALEITPQEDLQSRASLLVALGKACEGLSDYASAVQHFSQGLTLSRTIEDRGLEIHALTWLSILFGLLGRHDESKEYAQQARLMAEGKSEHQVTIAINLSNLGDMALNHGDFSAAADYFEEALAIEKLVENRVGIAINLNDLGRVGTARGEIESARRHFQESLDISRDIGRQRAIASNLYDLGRIARYCGDYAAAAVYHEESLVVHREAGNRKGIAQNLNSLGVIARYRGDPAEATRLHEESLTIHREIGNRIGISETLVDLGFNHIEQNQVDAAWRCFRESLSEATAIDAIPIVLWNLAGAAQVLTQEEQYERALGLAGLVLHHPATLAQTKTHAIEPLMAELREKVPTDELKAAIEHGQTLSLDTVVAEILGERT